MKLNLETLCFLVLETIKVIKKITKSMKLTLAILRTKLPGKKPSNKAEIINKVI
ncbi:hypothetical protein FC80_GL000428 [Liquorilactobacillus cacaonum DSM 21116]|uniref:Uncharacterized protein n=1 Tax=Liquorilactobacillus cacaonum DSM 21116 TaxID=1423729 RepID=A0A0R2CTT4_9LACO|nr:hypothetical protein FC80_GL000428 [Liquorilactobacillus cacaonum DSM 21116]